jgi:uncharacterized protein (TIGR03086 family)
MRDMNTLIDDYLTNADRFSAVVDAAGDWTAPSPCEGWTARDVLDHVVDSQRDFLVKRDLDPGPRPEGEPRRVWAAHLDGVRRVVADDAVVAAEYDGYFGRTSIADTLANFYGFDLVAHRWDLGRALGQEVRWTEDEMDRLEKAMAGFGDALYSEGVCKPALDVAADADRQTRLLAKMGRRA